MSDMPQNTEAFHNIYETTLESDTTKSMLHEGDDAKTNIYNKNAQHLTKLLT